MATWNWVVITSLLYLQITQQGTNNNSQATAIILEQWQKSKTKKIKIYNNNIYDNNNNYIKTDTVIV